MATTLLGQWGDDGMSPKSIKKLSLKAECLKCNNYLEEFFHTVLRHTRMNLLLPASGIVDDVLHNGDTLKLSIRTCWPRVQSDPFWSRFLHIFHWCKKQFSKDKRPSGSNRIIRRQTIQNASSLSKYSSKSSSEAFKLYLYGPVLSTVSWCLEPVMNRSTRPRF